ncbi:MAG: bifunctional (p)ppGpp synthetase/guanosine-3',5'-bis(diphosphate) 3'-pyrophosphohydrolase [Betaproteobacteria bacterium]|nr:bifunctional (p)ppGpp synthetase/guanosine-3',5'-bis(diphosphate) 3'-pyrophosphohydrolase [Betaproteobacteria bacterium]
MRSLQASLAARCCARSRSNIATNKALQELLSHAGYLRSKELARIERAFAFGEAAHAGQSRHSGEPYFTHPLAVAEVCTGWHLDADALVAALLHDTVEDCNISEEVIASEFGPVVAGLVLGLTKLDRMEFRSREEAQAENFRKMLLAMAEDVRVILIKLADRLHNMRTLHGLHADKRRRIAQETLDIYAPIAHRLGLNEVFREFEDLCFQGIYPTRFRVLHKALLSARGNRREIVGKLQDMVQKHLPKFGIKAEVTGREKSLFSIYAKMKEKHLTFSEVLDIYGFRLLVKNPSDCYLALGALHALFKPIPGKFKDYIALPKLNGYQSLHTVVVGPHGTPLEFQIRTVEMHRVAEAGVAAHWLYKVHEKEVSPLQRKAHEWMQSLLSAQTNDPGEFLDLVKIDLFPEVTYVFTPKGEIKELPRGSTPVDFAYTVHTAVGNLCAGCQINGQTRPLDTELRNGDMVRIETRPDASPHPGWLGFVKTAKARAEIRHALKGSTRERAIGFGKRLLENALKSHSIEGLDDPRLRWDLVFHEMPTHDRESLFESIGLGHTLAHVAALRLTTGVHDPSAGRPRRLSAAAQDALRLSLEHLTYEDATISLTGSEGTAVQYASCCYPIGGDRCVGHMRGGSGLLVHRASCPLAKRQRVKDSQRWADIEWSDPIHGVFETHLQVNMQDSPGSLARVAASITAARANIIDIGIERTGAGEPSVHVAIEVRDRKHLAQVLRYVRNTAAVSQAIRLIGKKSGAPTSALTASDRHPIN